jgi:site-specific DNA recombinase
MRPTKGLETIIRNMFSETWNQRLTQTNEIRKSLRRDILKLEKQVDSFLDRLVKTTSPTAVKAYERKIEKLEKEKLLTSEKLEKSCTPKVPANDMLELSLKFLSNSCKIWNSGDINLQKLVLRLVFSERLPYHRNEGYRTPQVSVPFELFGSFNENCQMVRAAGLEPARSFPIEGF